MTRISSTDTVFYLISTQAEIIETICCDYDEMIIVMMMTMMMMMI